VGNLILKKRSSGGTAMVTGGRRYNTQGDQYDYSINMGLPLFDKGYVTITPHEHVFLVSDRLRDEFENGRTYYDMKDRVIRMPAAACDRPSQEYLEWHASERFRG